MKTTPCAMSNLVPTGAGGARCLTSDLSIVALLEGLRLHRGTGIPVWNALHQGRREGGRVVHELRVDANEGAFHFNQKCQRELLPETSTASDLRFSPMHQPGRFVDGAL